MTTFANQTKNTVFAAPDGADGQPSFRALTSNDISSLPTTVMLSDFTLDTNVQTYITPEFRIPANTLANGSVIRLIFGFDYLAGPQSDILMHAGANGNISDPVIWAWSSDVQTSSLPQNAMLDALLTVRANGNSGNVQIAPLNINGSSAEKIWVVSYVTLNTEQDICIGFSANTLFNNSGSYFNTFLAQQLI